MSTTPDTTPEGVAAPTTTTVPYDVCQDATVTNKICGPATVGIGNDAPPALDVCLNLGNNVGQMSRSLVPCELPSATNALVFGAADTSCQEDEACWDCTTMGNLTCGPNTTTIAVARTLPTTGSTSAPLVGGAFTTLALGLVLVLAGARKRATA